MSSKTINISLDAALLAEIDKAAQAEYSSRSDFIRQSVVERIKSQRDNDWADFLAIANIAAASAQSQGITTGEDFARVVKQSRLKD